MPIGCRSDEPAECHSAFVWGVEQRGTFEISTRENYSHLYKYFWAKLPQSVNDDA